MITCTEKKPEAKFMKGVLTKFNFAYISGNDETQKRANVSLIIHYDHFLIQLEIINTSLGILAGELSSPCAAGHTLSLSRERNHSFLSAESKQENGKVKSKYITEVLHHLDKMLTALFACLFVCWLVFLRYLASDMTSPVEEQSLLTC